MRRITAILAILFILPASCSPSDQRLQKIAQDVFSQKAWRPPLPPNEFKSDGCSCWPDYDWLECCVEHDALYWLGGTREEREQADLDLQKCISQKGHPYIGKVMYYGVRAGGVYWLPTPFRWGFGWNFPQSGPPDKEY